MAWGPALDYRLSDNVSRDGTHFLWPSKVSFGVGGQRSGSVPPWLRVREFKPMLCDCVIVSILALEGLWLAGITETSAPVSRRPEKRMVDFESYIQAQQRDKRLKPKVKSQGTIGWGWRATATVFLCSNFQLVDALGFRVQTRGTLLYEAMPSQASFLFF